MCLLLLLAKLCPKETHPLVGFNPIKKKCSSNWIISPGKGEHKKKLKPPTTVVPIFIPPKKKHTPLLEFQPKNFDNSEKFPPRCKAFFCGHSGRSAVGPMAVNKAQTDSKAFPRLRGRLVSRIGGSKPPKKTWGGRSLRLNR